MIVFMRTVPNAETAEIVLEVGHRGTSDTATDKGEAIELFGALRWPITKQAGLRLETINGQIRLYIPIRDWPCHSDPRGQSAHCDALGTDHKDFMGHTCANVKT